MSQQVIQVNFQYKGSKEEYSNAASMVADIFANLPGLQWKIWLLNEEKKEGGGIYLFADKKAVDDYRNSDLFKYISTSPDYLNFNVKQFDTMEAPGALTNAPVRITHSIF